MAQLLNRWGFFPISSFECKEMWPFVSTTEQTAEGPMGIPERLSYFQNFYNSAILKTITT